MILIVESGSTKTDWILANKECIIASCSTKGLSPYFVTSSDIENVIKNEVLPTFGDNYPEKIFFYGSGCSTNANKNIIISGFIRVFDKSEIIVEHDLMASVHALFSNHKGIACILGTGSNTCLYDGSKIIQGINSLGYVLGDEGSGAYLGKKLIKAYFYNEIPADLALLFKTEYNISLENVLDAIYKQPSPNKYLAGFSPFLKKNIQIPYVRNFVKETFVDFINKMILCYPNYKNYPLGFVGSIAQVYEDVLTEVTNDFGMKIEKISKNPIQDLLKYHQTKI